MSTRRVVCAAVLSIGVQRGEKEQSHRTMVRELGQKAVPSSMRGPRPLDSTLVDIILRVASRPSSVRPQAPFVRMQGAAARRLRRDGEGDTLQPARKGRANRSVHCSVAVGPRMYVLKGTTHSSVRMSMSSKPRDSVVFQRE